MYADKVKLPNMSCCTVDAPKNIAKKARVMRHLRGWMRQGVFYLLVDGRRQRHKVQSCMRLQLQTVRRVVAQQQLSQMN